MTGNVRGRLEILEARARRHQPGRSPDGRRRMKAHLDQAARLRRGELSEEEAAEVRATNAALEDRARAIRGEGGR